MSSTLPAYWLAALTAIAALNASAQTAPAVAASAPASASVAAPRTSTPPGSYRSAFEGYRPFSEEEVRPWKESNDTVRTVGGWRAYAKEAAEDGGKSGEASKPAAAASSPRPGQAKP